MEGDETDLEVDELDLFVYSLEVSEEAQSIYSMKTPPLEAGTKPIGVSKGGGMRKLSPLVEHGDSNPVFDIT